MPSFRDRLKRWHKTFESRKALRIRYWVTAALVLAATVWVRPYVEDYLNLIQVRYWLFQTLTEFSPRPLEPRFVKVVLIGDAEHWGLQLQGRSPTKRDYIAKLVDALDAANARVIALDFDLRNTDPSAKGAPGDYAEVPGDYKAETDMLMRTIARAAQRHKFVLAKTIRFGDRHDYKLGKDLYQIYGLCTALGKDGKWQNPGTPALRLSPRAQRNISCGYIALPYDMRLLPPRLKLESGGTIDSFSFAIAKAINPQIANAVTDRSYYGSYIPTATIASNNVISAARDLLAQNPGTMDNLNSQAVIVGGDWHVESTGSGRIVDTHETPIGENSGALVHQNFAEAILDSRTYAFVPEWVLTLAEIAFGLMAAILFAIWPRVIFKVAVFFGLCAALLLLQWAMLQIFGTFFEAFLPLLGLALHSIVERLLGHEPNFHLRPQF